MNKYVIYWNSVRLSTYCFTAGGHYVVEARNKLGAQKVFLDAMKKKPLHGERIYIVSVTEG